MAREFTTEIYDNEYIGDSLVTINNNFNTLDTSCQTINTLLTSFLPLTGGIISGNLSVTNGLTATTIFTTGSGNVIIDRGNYRSNNDTTIILGANSNQHLRFRAGGDTNNEIRMTILSSGAVGIGTTLTETASAGNGGLIVKNNLLVNGNIRFSNVPTLSDNLPIGTVWNNNGILSIIIP